MIFLLATLLAATFGVLPQSPRYAPSATPAAGNPPQCLATQGPKEKRSHKKRHKKRRKKHRAAAVALAGLADPRRQADPTRQAERLLRRRVVRLARIAMLERKEASLGQLLTDAATERSLLVDNRVVSVFDGVLVGPTEATVDFIGSPLIRARVKNTSPRSISVLLTAAIRGGEGPEATASLAVERLAPGEARPVELLCPAALTPTSIAWSAVAL